MNFTIDVNINGLDELSKALRVIAVVMAEKHEKPPKPPKVTPEEDAAAKEEAAPEESGNYCEVVESEESKEDLPWNEPVKEEPVKEEPAAPVVKEEPTATAAPVAQEAKQEAREVKPSHTLDEVTAKAISILDAGNQAGLLNLLSKYGVQALPDLPADKYDSFYSDLEAL